MDIQSSRSRIRKGNGECLISNLIECLTMNQEVYPPNMPPPGYAAVRGVPPQQAAPPAEAAPEPQQVNVFIFCLVCIKLFYQTFTFPDCSAGPSLNVAFLKTHKTGSSTMSNIMLRFAGK